MLLATVVDSVTRDPLDMVNTPKALKESGHGCGWRVADLGVSERMLRVQ